MPRSFRAPTRGRAVLSHMCGGSLFTRGLTESAIGYRLTLSRVKLSPSGLSVPLSAKLGAVNKCSEKEKQKFFFLLKNYPYRGSLKAYGYC